MNTFLISADFDLLLIFIFKHKTNAISKVFFTCYMRIKLFILLLIEHFFSFNLKLIKINRKFFYKYRCKNVKFSEIWVY